MRPSKLDNNNCTYDNNGSIVDLNNNVNNEFVTCHFSIVHVKNTSIKLISRIKVCLI